MSLLILLRERLKTVATIKKTTNAMRLISMSTHSRLRAKKTHLDAYHHEIQRVSTLLGAKKGTAPELAELQNGHELILLIGSQKGLCGTFNSALFHFFEKHRQEHSSTSIIAVGKHAHDYLTAKKLSSIAAFDQFSAQNFISICNKLCDMILTQRTLTKLVIYSNYPQTFFLQRPIITKKNIVHETGAPIALTQEIPDIILEQPLTQIQQSLNKLALQTLLQKVLFESLLAEQSARFLSMYTATQNADKVIQEMKLEYNKLRQTKVTNELMDLASGIFS